MITLAFIVLIAALLIVFLITLVRQRHATTDVNELYSRLKPIYVPALLNLINPGDLIFLRTRLRRSDFLKVKRARARALIDYVGRIAFNARTLTSIGTLYRQSAQPELASAGQSLVSRAASTRILALRTLVFLKIEFILPFFDTNLTPTLSAYERAKARLDGISSTLIPAR